MFQFIQTAINLGIWAAVGVGALALGLWVILGPAGRVIGATGRLVVAVICFTVFGFASGNLYTADDAKRQLRQLEKEVEDAKDRADELSDQAQERIERLQELEGLVEGYENELNNGTANFCPADPAYTRRLLRIIDGDGS